MATSVGYQTRPNDAQQIVILSVRNSMSCACAYAPLSPAPYVRDWCTPMKGLHTYAEPASRPCDSRTASSIQLRHPAPYICIADWLHHNQNFTRSRHTQCLLPCTHRFPKASALESTRAYSNSRLGNPSSIDLMKSCIIRICHRLYIQDRDP